MMQEEREQIGRFKVRSLMRELALVSKQPGSHAYKKATVERPDIPNILTVRLMSKRQIRSGVATSITFGRRANGTIWQLFWISTHAE
ncbi:DDE-type integrase/transposase/recombinase [Pseudomonas sp. S60]|nr:DDE-type integrase/transposase/recombinase [Pseudomonas sp. S60]